MVNSITPTLVTIVMTIVGNLWHNGAKSPKEYIFQHAEIISPVLREVTPSKEALTTLRHVVAYWKEAFPDVESHWDDVIERENSVIIKWSAKGTHIGKPFLGYPALGKHVCYDGTTTYTFEKGKLIHYVADVDVDAIIKQIK